MLLTGCYLQNMFKNRPFSTHYLQSITIVSTQYLHTIYKVSPYCHHSVYRVSPHYLQTIYTVSTYFPHIITIVSTRYLQSITVVSPLICNPHAPINVYYAQKVISHSYIGRGCDVWHWYTSDSMTRA